MEIYQHNIHADMEPIVHDIETPVSLDN